MLLECFVFVVAWVFAVYLSDVLMRKGISLLLDFMVYFIVDCMTSIDYRIRQADYERDVLRMRANLLASTISEKRMRGAS